MANIQNEFGVDPLKLEPGRIKVERKDMPENCFPNNELLETLFNIRNTEVEPDIITNMDALIDKVCVG